MLEKLSPRNSEILAKNLCRLSRNCIFSGGTFYFEPSYILKQVFFGQLLASGKRQQCRCRYARPAICLCFQDQREAVWSRSNDFEQFSTWSLILAYSCRKAVTKLDKWHVAALEQKRAVRKFRMQTCNSLSVWTCSSYSRICSCGIGVYAHQRKRDDKRSWVPTAQSMCAVWLTVQEKENAVVKFSRNAGRNGVPQPVSGVPPSDWNCPSPPKVVTPSPGDFLVSWFSGKSLQLLPLEVRI